MSDKDTITKSYMEDAENFADAFNFLIYGGEQVIKAENLHPMDTTELVLPFGSDSTSAPAQKYRDVLKQLTAMSDGKNAYLILGIENQSNVHYAMPVRNMLYDAMQFSSQVEASARSHRKEHNNKPTADEFLSGWYKEDRLLPIITLVIYFGANKWDAPTSIHEMMSVQDDAILKFIPDYKINLIAPEALSDDEFDKFHTGLREVLKYIKYSKDKDKLRTVVTEDTAYRSLDHRTAETINIVTNSEMTFSKGEERIDMCEAIKGIRLEGIEEGRLEGHLEGVVDGKVESLINIMKNINLSLEQSLSALNIPEDQWEQYKHLVEKALEKEL